MTPQSIRVYLHSTTNVYVDWQDNTMVFYFKSAIVEPAAFIYVGKDKVESEAVHRDCSDTQYTSSLRMLTGLEMRT